MTFSMRHHREHDLAVLRVAGEVDLHVADALVGEALALEADRMVIDLADVTFIDSSGLHALLRIQRHVAGGLALRNVTPVTARVLELAGLGDVFAVDDGA